MLTEKSMARMMNSPASTDNSSMSSERTALLIRCSKEETEKIQTAAKRERRTLSGYVLHTVLSRISNQERRGYIRPLAALLGTKFCALPSRFRKISATFSANCR